MGRAHRRGPRLASVPRVGGARPGFRVRRAEDVAAASCSSRSRWSSAPGRQRARTGRAPRSREREARLLATLSSSLFSGEVPERVIDELAELLLEPLGSSSGAGRRRPSTVRRSTPTARTAGGTAGGPATHRPDRGRARHPDRHARRRAARRRRPLSRQEQQLLEAAARQAARRSTARGWTLAPGSRSSTPRRTCSAPRCSARSRTTCGRPLASIKAGVTSLLDESSTYDAGAGARAADDDPRGDRPAQPARRQHPRPREDPGGRADRPARRGRDRRGRRDGRWPPPSPARRGRRSR